MRRKKKESLLGILKQSLTPPAQELYLGSAIHISDRGSVQIENCKGVSVYNENYVQVRLSGCSVRVSGDGLMLLTLTTGTVSVEGRLFNVEFIYD